MLTATRIHCENEYDKLMRVILCPPQYMRIEEVINEAQKQLSDKNINSELAVKQHRALTSVLEENNIEVLQLTPREKYPEQVYTRDIGFVLGDSFFVSSMATDIRKGEIDVLIEWLNSNNILFTKIGTGVIEGGDVIIDKKNIWAGISNRTSMSAIDALKQNLSSYEVHVINFDKKYLHIDCVFNIISDRDALIYYPAFDKQDINILTAYYNLIDIDENEQFTLGTNVLSIGNRKIISSPVNANTNSKLRNNGYQVIEVDISEILKSGGSFRCISLPLLRQ